MQHSSLPLTYRLFRRRNVHRAIAQVPVVFVPGKIPESTSNAMFLEDIPLYRLIRSFDANSGLFPGLARDIRNSVRERNAGTATIDVRDLRGVFNSKSSGMTWAEFCEREGRSRENRYGGILGCESRQDAERLLKSLSYVKGPYRVHRIHWTRQVYWGSGENGGSHRIAAVADWCVKNDSSLPIETEVNEHFLSDTVKPLLTRFRLGIMPLETAYALAEIGRTQETWIQVLRVDSEVLYHRTNEKPVAVVALPLDDAIVRDFAPAIEERSDWMDISPMFLPPSIF